jgi:hypothetical protein
MWHGFWICLGTYSFKMWMIEVESEWKSHNMSCAVYLFDLLNFLVMSEVTITSEELFVDTIKQRYLHAKLSRIRAMYWKINQFNMYHLDEFQSFTERRPKQSIHCFKKLANTLLTAVFRRDSLIMEIAEHCGKFDSNCQAVTCASAGRSNYSDNHSKGRRFSYLTCIALRRRQLLHRLHV